MKTFFNIILGVTILLCVTAAVLLLVSSFKIPGLPLDARSVLTGSMEPAIPTGSIVFILPKESYSVDDIITFKRGESTLEAPITHRIIEAKEDDMGNVVFTTKGDANEIADFAPVSQSEVLGKVVFHIPYVGKLLELAKTPWGFVALVVIPALLVIGEEVKKIIVHVQKNGSAPEGKKNDGED